MKTFFTAIILLFALSCRAQITGPRTTDTLIFYTPFSWVNSLSLITPTLTGNYVWQLPDGNGTGTGFFTNDGTGVTSWTALSGLGTDFILNQNASPQTASFDISGSGNIGSALNVTGNIGGTSENLSSTLIVTGQVTLQNTEASTSGHYALLQVDNSGIVSTPTPPAGGIPIGDGVDNLIAFAVPTAGPGILITPGTGTLTIASDIDSSFTAGPGIDFAGSTAGNLHINSHADSTGAMFILNQTASEQTGGFYVGTAAAAPVVAPGRILNDATSSTSSNLNTAMALGCQGVNSGSGAENLGLSIAVSGGTNNIDISGDSWNVDNGGNFSIEAVTLGNNLITSGSAGTSGQVLVSQGSGSPPKWEGPAFVSANPSNPTGTLASSMMGLGNAGASITPTKSGIVTFTISGTVTNTATQKGTVINLFWGTGTAPGNSSSPSGTQVGATEEQLVTTTGIGGVNVFSSMPFCITATVNTGFVGVPCWWDVELTAVGIGVGTSSISGVYVMAIEE